MIKKESEPLAQNYNMPRRKIRGKFLVKTEVRLRHAAVAEDIQ